MDVFLEYLIRKKPSGVDVAKKLGLVLAAVLVSIVVIMFFSAIPILRSYVFVALAGVVYGLVVLLRNFNVEYEYIFTNGDLDIDIVKAQRSRKRMVSLKVRDIEVMASDANTTYKQDFENDHFSKKYRAVFDETQGHIYHVIFSSDGKRIRLTFQPPAKLLEAMKKMNPHSVNVDPEDMPADKESAE